MLFKIYSQIVKVKLPVPAPPGPAAGADPLLGQVYLEPNPKELMLPNHA